MIELSEENQAFFEDRQNWMYGPIFFLEFTWAELYSAEQIAAVIHEFPGFFAWKQSRHGFARSILWQPTELSHSVGFGQIAVPRDLNYELFIYPGAFARVCGCECWQLKDNQTDLRAFQRLMAILIDLARHVAKHLKLRNASISSEDWRIDNQNTHRIFILEEYARLGGITDFEREDAWVVSVPLEQPNRAF